MWEVDNRRHALRFKWDRFGIGGFYNNMLDEHFPKFWYWMNDEELAERRAKQPSDWELAPAHGPSGGLYAPGHVPGQWD